MSSHGFINYIQSRYWGGDSVKEGMRVEKYSCKYIDGGIMQGRCHLKMGGLDLFDPLVLTHLSSIHIPWSYVRLPSRSAVSCPGSIYLWSPSRLVRLVWNTNIRLQHIQVNGSPTPTLLWTLQVFLRINDSETHSFMIRWVKFSQNLNHFDQ